MIEKLSKRDYFEDPNLPLQVYIRDPHPLFPLHSHEFDELVIILQGTALHVVDGHPFPVHGGDVFVIAGDHEHQYTEMNELALANILFDADQLGMANWDIRALSGFHVLFKLEPRLRSRSEFNSRLHLSERRLNRAKELLHDLHLETESRHPGYRVMACGLFMQMAVFLSRCHTEKPTEESINLLRLGDAIAHMETRYADTITLDDLARRAHLSTRHFQRIFQECMKHSPIDYLLHIRVQKAAEMLRHGGRSITEIAFDCGFSDGNYFSRCFRKITGITPGRYSKGCIAL